MIRRRKQYEVLKSGHVGWYKEVTRLYVLHCPLLSTGYLGRSVLTPETEMGFPRLTL